MEEKLRVLAMAVLSKDDFQIFAKMNFDKDWDGAMTILMKAHDDAKEQVLDTVYKDVCDFVLFSYYRQTTNLLKMFKGE